MATHYVSSTGSATWGESTNISTPCSLATANANADAGDLVYFRGGTYHIAAGGRAFDPAHSGTSNTNRITFSGYGSEEVIFEGSSATAENNDVAILFGTRGSSSTPSDGNNYISIKNFKFRYFWRHFDWRYSSHNELSNCEFTGYGTSSRGHEMGYLLYSSQHNWIHDCKFYYWGSYSVSGDGGIILEIGINNPDAISDWIPEKGHCDYNTIENCHMYAGGHHVFGLNTARYCVVRNNYVHNESWCPDGDCANFLPSGKCGYRIWSMTCGSEDGGHNLLEGNRVGYGAQYGGPNVRYGAGSGLTIGSDSNICRYNGFFANVMCGIRIGASISSVSTDDNRIYNNTFFHHGWNEEYWTQDPHEEGVYPAGPINEDDEGALDIYRCAFRFEVARLRVGNVIKNNLAYDTWSVNHTWSGSTHYSAFQTAEGNTVEHNWTAELTAGEQNAPKFIDRDCSTPLNGWPIDGTERPNLRLGAGSPCIGGGTHLTTVSSITDSNTIVVADATYFQDGTWGSDLARSALYADWICLTPGTTVNYDHCVQISSISGNTINTSTAHGASAGWYVWLYRKSDGTRVLYGSAPDYGAYEYEGTDVVPPTLLTASIGTNGTTWTFNFSEPVKFGLGGSAGWAVSMSTQGAIALTYASGSTSSTLLYTGSKTVKAGETVTFGLYYSQPNNGIENLAGNDLASIIVAKSVTNNSTQGQVYSKSKAGSAGFAGLLTNVRGKRTVSKSVGGSAGFEKKDTKRKGYTKQNIWVT